MSFGDGTETARLTTRLHDGAWLSGQVLHVTVDWVIDAGELVGDLRPQRPHRVA